MRVENKLYKNQGIHVIASIFTIDKGKVKVLLIKRKNEPFKDNWALVGGALYNNESLEYGIKREIEEKSGIKDLDIYQFGVFDELDKTPNIPIRMIAIAYLGIVDGKRIGNIGASIIKDRKIMSTDGVLIIILNIDSELRQLSLDPNVTTRGFVVVNENQNLINDIQKKVKQIALNELNKDSFNYVDLKNRIILEINSFIIELTGRRPIIMPMILETKKN